MKKIQLIVEGEGDSAALPTLVTRVLRAHGIHDVHLPSPHLRGELPMVKTNFNRYFATAVETGYPILCVLDFDCEDCIDVLAEEASLRKLAQAIRPNYPFDACFIVKEYESLLLWDEACVRQQFPDIPSQYKFPIDPEAVRDAKGALKAGRPKGGTYKPVAHQKAMSSKVNLALLRERSASFRRLEKAILNLAQ